MAFQRGGSYSTGGDLFYVIQKDLGLIGLSLLQEVIEEVKFIVFDEAMVWAVEYFPFLTGLLLSTFREMRYEITTEGFTVEYGVDPIDKKGVAYAAIVNMRDQFFDRVSELIEQKFNEYIPIVFNRKAQEQLQNLHAVMD